MRRLFTALLLLSLPSCNTAKAILTADDRRAAEKAEQEAADRENTEKLMAQGQEMAAQMEGQQAESSASSREIVESATLKAELRNALPEIYAETKETPPADLDKATDEMIANLREADPNFLKVTALVEQEFVNGKVNVSEARRRMEKTVGKVQTVRIELPSAPLVLARNKDGKQPAPLRVELAAHLLEAMCRAKAKADGKAWPEGD